MKSWLAGFYSKSTLEFIYAENFYFVLLIIGYFWKGLIMKSAFLLIVWIFKSVYGYLFAAEIYGPISLIGRLFLFSGSWLCYENLLFQIDLSCFLCCRKLFEYGWDFYIDVSYYVWLSIWAFRWRGSCFSMKEL